MTEINTSAPGIYMYVTPNKRSSIVQITGGKDDDVYTEGDILTSQTCKIHLGTKGSMEQTVSVHCVGEVLWNKVAGM